MVIKRLQNSAGHHAVVHPFSTPASCDGGLPKGGHLFTFTGHLLELHQSNVSHVLVFFFIVIYTWMSLVCLLLLLFFFFFLPYPVIYSIFDTCYWESLDGILRFKSTFLILLYVVIAYRTHKSGIIYIKSCRCVTKHLY